MDRVPTLAAQRQLALQLRRDAQGQAGKTGVISKLSQTALGPFLQDEAAAFRASSPGKRLTVDRLVDRAMADAMTLWDLYNPKSSPKNHAILSQKEAAAINQANPKLGVLTIQARQDVLKALPTKDLSLVPTVTLESQVPGFTLSHDADIFTVQAAASVPTGSKFTLSIDGQSFELQRFPGGLGLYALAAPEGYGAESISDSTTKGVTTAAIRIQKDPPGGLTAADALVKARAALIDYVKNQRVKDSDWKDMIGMSWDEAVAHGVLNDIAKFAEPGPDSSIERRPDRFTFVGAGPLGLYTEATVRKSDGKVLRSYVEID